MKLCYLKAMETCTNHPDRETKYMCMKYQIAMCEECMLCRDPKLYCKFRPSCPIWYVHKEKIRAEKAAEKAAENSDSNRY